MREHAIPQDVVGYKFHIIGNMTLKQFLEVGAGCVVGLAIYSTNLYNVVKWPLIGVVVAIGAMAAFVPFEERPLDHWFVTFFKILYKPTKFFWRKEPKIPDPFLYKSEDQNLLVSEMDFSPVRRQRIKDYLGSLDAVSNNSQYDQAELDRLNSIMSAFNTISPSQVSISKGSQKPHLRLRTHTLKKINITLNDPEAVEEDYTQNVRIIEEDAPQQVAYNLQKPQLQVAQVAQNISIPDTEEITLKKVKDATTTVSEEAPTLLNEQRAFSTVEATTQSLNPSQQVAINKTLPFPVKPTEPNKLVGMVLSPGDNIITDAIVEIQNSEGKVARAVKTNALGQFFITTPLTNGEYVVLVEKDGYQFQPYSLSLTGSAVEPLEIRSIV